MADGDSARARYDGSLASFASQPYPPRWTRSADRGGYGTIPRDQSPEGVIMELGAKGMWKQREFIISSFHPVTGGDTDLQLVRRHKEAGFNLLEMTFVDRFAAQRALVYGESLGMNVLVGEISDPSPRFGGFQNVTLGEGAEESIRSAIEFYGQPSSLYGYYVWDEPEPVNFESVGRQVALFNQYVPNKLAFVVAMPSYWEYFGGDSQRYERYWDDLAAIVKPQVVSSNHYPFYNEIRRGIPLERSSVWRDLGYVRRKSLELEVPMWFYIQLSDDLITNDLGNMTIEKVRLQAYYALAYGATGISYYNTLNALMDSHGTPSSLFESIRRFNSEIKNLGTVLLDARTTGVYHTGDVQAPYIDELDTVSYLKSVPDNLILGTFEVADGHVYVLFVNRSYESPLRGTVTFTKAVRILEVSKMHGGLDLVSPETRSLSLDLDAGEGVLLRIEGADGSLLD